MKEKISVLMSLYNEEKSEFLEISLSSILNQTLRPSQIVLVIDGPISIELEKIVASYDDKFEGLFNIVRLNENKGLGFALNHGLKLCKYRLVARMDTDDESLPYRFEEQVNEFIRNPNLDIVGGYVNDIDITGKHLKIRTVPTLHADIEKLIWSCPFIHPTVMFDKTKIIEIGGYNDGLRRRQDYDLWYRALYNNLKFKNLDIPLLNYRNDVESYTKKNNFTVQYQQLKIGLKGNKMNSLSFKSYLMVISNFILKVQPIFIQKKLSGLVSHFDPRNTRKVR